MSDEPRPRYWLHLLLFGATVFTTTAQGALFIHGESIFPLRDGLSYSMPLLAILLCHEFGHYFAARFHGVPASLPYFIPLPPPVGLLGTMGAVIFQSGTSDRKKLIDIGAAGPLAGMIVAIPVLVYGIAHSEVRSLPAGALQEGNSLLYGGLKLALKGEWLPSAGRDIVLHPTAWAGWAGLLVTMLNLLPVGQLDGGHIATAYLGNRYARVARWIHRALPLLAITVMAFVYVTIQRDVAGGARLPQGWSVPMIAVEAGLPWVVWFVLLLVLGRLSRGGDHPPVDEGRLPPSRAGLFWIAFLTFLLIFMPVPLRIGVGAADAEEKPTPAPTNPVSP